MSHQRGGAASLTEFPRAADMSAVSPSPGDCASTISNTGIQTTKSGEDRRQFLTQDPWVSSGLASALSRRRSRVRIHVGMSADCATAFPAPLTGTS